MNLRTVLICLGCLAAPASAQHSLSRIVTVGPSRNADATTIQGAINSIPQTGTPAQHKVLVCAGISAADGRLSPGDDWFSGDAPATRAVELLDCTISAEVTSNGDRAFGAIGDEAESVVLVGGSVNAIDADERQTALYDVYSESTAEVRVRTSGTEFSRWKGAIGAAVGQDGEVLRVVDVPSAGAATVLSATALLDTERTITNGFTQLEVYRVLSVTSNDPNLTNKSVIIIGRDWGNRPIADSIQINGTSTVPGVKPFRSVTKIVLPAKTDDNQTVSVGTTEILGLHAPISDTGDVLQVATKTSAGNSYVIESTIGTVSAERGTVDISSLSPADDDSIEFTYRASK